MTLLEHNLKIKPTKLNDRIFLSPPHMGGEEMRYVKEAFESNYIAPLGPQVDAFEKAFCEYTGFRYAVALTSGTAAMHLALRYLIGSAVSSEQRAVSSKQQTTRWTRDEIETISSAQLKRSSQLTSFHRPLVFASTLTFIGSVTPATFEGCDITFIDCDRETWNMDPDLLAEELARCAEAGRLPVAVIPTDLYGQCCDLARIVEICDGYGVPVVCDSAEAVGARYYKEVRGQKSEVGKDQKTNRDRKSEVGGQEKRRHLQNPKQFRNSNAQDSKRKAVSSVQLADLGPQTSDLCHHAGYGASAAVYSFNGNKIITTSGGGMLASDDKEMIEKARFWSQQARDPFPHYEHTEIGYNYRMSNIVAAIGLGQLGVLDERVRRKREIFDYYRNALGDLPGIEFMPEADYGRSNRWLTVILIDPDKFGADREDVRLALEGENIESRPVWKPMHLQPVFHPQITQITADLNSNDQEAVGRNCRRSEVGDQRSGTAQETMSNEQLKSSSQFTVHGSRFTPSIRVVGGGVSEGLFERGLCLPSGTAMDSGDLARVVRVIKSVNSER